MQKLLLIISVLMITVISITACAPLDVLNATVSDNGYQSKTDIAYGSHPRQKLDVHIPQDKQTGDVVIFFYGGRWSSGEKQDYRFIAEAFTSHGIITVIPNYQLYPRIRFPVFIEDGAQAYQWVIKNIEKFKGNKRRVFLAGHSAGGYIAAMLALDENYIQNTNTRQLPCGTIGYAGPYDFLPFDADDLIQIFTTPLHPTRTQPITFVDGSENPLLLLMGNDDVTVKERNAPNLHRRIQSRKGKSTLIRYDGIDHIDMLLALSSTFRGKAPILDDSIKFIRKTTCVAVNK